jgi:hypothetical protein
MVDWSKSEEKQRFIGARAGRNRGSSRQELGRAKLQLSKSWVEQSFN